MRNDRSGSFISRAGLVLMSGILIGIFALANAGETSGGEEKATAQAESLWANITKSDSYLKWKPFPAKGKDGLFFAVERGPTPAKNPHGAYMRLFINEIALKSAQQNPSGPMPTGAILVMENYGRDKKTLFSITAMQKLKGFAPEQGDWFWASYTPDGKAAEAGKVQSCIDCHRARKGNDWRYAGSRGHQHHGHN